MLSLPGQTWLLALVWLLIGLGVYFTYGRVHSHLRRAHT
jgi:APA family basic amino acid/polyamine antiporter